VTREGYLSRKFPVRIVDGEVTVPVTLEKAPRRDRNNTA